MADLDQLVRYLDAELRTHEVPDSDAALNGLQLANSGRVTRVAAAVDFSLQTVTAAVREQANLLVVHHGMFWRGAQALTGRAYDRVKAAIAGDLAVYSTHIPLDLHPTFGNNALLAKALGLTSSGTFGRYRDVEIGVQGTSDVDTAELVNRVRAFSAAFDTNAVATPFSPGRRTRRWAIITGAGASPDVLAEARERSVDTLIVGEGTHHSAVEAIEHELVVVYGGHYATETLGVRALATHLAEQFRLTSVFVNVPTGL
ncbi:MAG TPA: Nif3-like dinuclear metal center hexameric protein [Gemmatimonadaceae bacterium]|nr:Nif3-like dinuclear metal center hexameric protein [Gemmatimonadaceae bacterium]